MHLVTVAHMISSIRNGSLAGLKFVYVKSSRLVTNMLKALKRDGYIADYSFESDRAYHSKVFLKYDSKGIPVIRFIQQYSKPSRSIYASSNKFKTTEQYSTLLVSTSKLGVVSHIDARKAGVGGLILCEVAA